MKKVILLLLVFASILSIYGQTYSEFTKEFYTWNNKKLPYRIYSPQDKSKKYPLVIFLHGIGERGSDNEIQLKNGKTGDFLTTIKNNYSAIIVAPQCPYSSNPADRYYWSNAIQETASGLKFDFTKKEPTIPMQMLMSLITNLINSGQVDPNEVYVGGLSMGGFGAYELLWRMSNVFKGAFPICGLSTTDQSSLESYVSKVRIWTFHGALDNIVSISLGNNIYNAIQEIPKSNIKYTIYDNVYHNSWLNAFKEPKLIPWIFGFNPLEKGYYKIEANDSSNDALTINGRNYSMSSFLGLDSQSWLIYDGEIAGTYRIQSGDGSNLYLTSDGNNVNLTNYSSSNKQLWKIQETDTKGLYYISSLQDNSNLDYQNKSLKLSTGAKYKWNLSHNKLFLVGNAVSSGWNLNKVIEMKSDTEQNGLFKWKGIITSGTAQFKFQTTKDQTWVPTVNAITNLSPIKSSNQEYKLVINTDYKRDYKFSMVEPGSYEVTVDMNNKMMSVKKYYENIFLTGDVTPTGWDNNNGLKLTKDGLFFEWSGYLKAGSFNFLTQKGTSSYSLSALSSDLLISENDSLKTYPIKFNPTESGNYKFKINNGGFYKIRIDTDKGTLAMFKRNIENLWMTGSAVSNEVIQINNLKDNSSKYKYTGVLNNGTVRFFTKNPFTSENVFFDPSINNLSVINSAKVNIGSDSNSLYWNVPQTSNSYRLTIDLNKLLLDGEIFTPRSVNYYLIGNATSAAWVIQKAIPFIKDPSNINVYTLITTLYGNTGSQFKIMQQQNWWGYSFHPTNYNKTLVNGTDTYEEQYGYGGANDYKWTINSNDAGRYLITLNLLDQTISFERLQETKSLTKSLVLESMQSNIQILSQGSNILIKNNSGKLINSAVLIELGKGRIYKTEINKSGDFYLGTYIPKGIYVVKILQESFSINKKIVIK